MTSQPSAGLRYLQTAADLVGRLGSRECSDVAGGDAANERLLHADHAR